MMKKQLLGLFACAFAVVANAAEPWKIRAVQLDLARQMETVEFLKDYAEKISGAGMNTLVLYLEGRVKTPSVSFMKDAECYTPDEMREVVAHAAKFGVDCVPVVSILSHADRFTRYDEMKPLSEGRANKGRSGTFCLSKPETRAFLEKYIAEVAAIFPSKHFHMGFDEAWDMGTCELCAPVRKEKGMGPLFTEFVKFAHGLAAKNGKRMWMWDDLYEFFPEELANCPKDVVMCNWKYEPISPWGIRARFADSTRVDWMAEYAKHGIECIASCNVGEMNIRTFTAYARKHPNCLGGLVTQWSMSTLHHGARIPMVLGAGLYWTKAWDDPAADVVELGAKAAFPSLAGDELVAAEALLDQGSGFLSRPSFRAAGNRNLWTLPRLKGRHGEDLAIEVLKRSALKPGSGEIDPRALSEKALLDDLVTDMTYARFTDTLKTTATLLQSPERTVEDVRSAKAAIVAAEPRFRAAAERRWEQRNAWRGDAMWPHEFPRADVGKKEIAALLATPETTAAEDEWWLVADLNVFDGFGNLQLFVYGEFDGEWKRIAVGDWSGTAASGCFQRIVPFKSEVAPAALRISSEKGIGICGLNYIACVNRSRRLVPASIVSASGFVKDEGNILVDNLYPVVFGFPDRTRNAFHRDGKKAFVGTLEVEVR